MIQTSRATALAIKYPMATWLHATMTPVHTNGSITNAWESPSLQRESGIAPNAQRPCGVAAIARTDAQLGLLLDLNEY